MYDLDGTWFGVDVFASETDTLLKTWCLWTLLDWLVTQGKQSDQGNANQTWDIIIGTGMSSYLLCKASSIRLVG